MINVIGGLVLAAILAAAITYIVKQRKKVSNALDVPMRAAVRLRTDPAAVDPVLTRMK